MNAIIRQAASTAFAIALLSGAPLAQQATAPAPPTRQAPVQVGPERQDIVVGRRIAAEALRDQLRELLDRHPPSLSQVLRLDPSLLTDESYLAPYPELAAFLAEHPEVAHNPAFYIGTPFDSEWNRDPRAAAFRIWENIMQGFFILLVFSTITGVLVWLIRTLVEHRRWLRLSKVQIETHTKLLERFTSQEDLLAYIQTPAGRRFLEAAPMVIEAGARPVSAPFSRVLWSIQAGVVLSVAGLGVLLVGNRSGVPEVAEGIGAIGTLIVALGIGFVLSALVAYLLSRRMGLMPAGGGASAGPAVETGLPHVRD